MAIVFISSSYSSGFYNETKAINLSKPNLEKIYPYKNYFENEVLSIDSDENDPGTGGGDAGNTTGDATAITPGEYNGTLKEAIPADIDYYWFTVGEGVIINVSMISLNIEKNFDLTLYREDTSVITTNPKGAGIRETIIWSTISDGIYFISINSAVEDIGNYSFSIVLTQQNDFNTNTDAGNYPSTSIAISQGFGNGTLITASDETDYYEIEISRGQIINITLEFLNTTNLDLEFRDNEGVILDASEKIIVNNESIYYAINTAGNYKIGISLTELFDANKIFVPYNLTIIISTQNDGGFNTDAGDTPQDAQFITPLKNSIFRGVLIEKGDTKDFYTFNVTKPSILFISLNFTSDFNFDLFLYDSDTIIDSSTNEIFGAPEQFIAIELVNGTFYICTEFIDGYKIEGEYFLTVGLLDNPAPTTNGTPNWGQIIPIIISSVLVPIFLLTTIILALYLFTDVRIPGISNRLDRYFSKEGKEETAKSLKYALRVRDETISNLREDLIEKDSKRAKDLETIHRLEEDQKSKDIVITKLREENITLKTRLDNLQAVNDDLANIIDSTIRRQLSKSSKPTQKAKVSSITALIWLPEERLVNYINSIPLLNERYIMDKSKNFILTKEHAREIVRQAYWKRVGAMHLKKIKQVKVSNLADDTNIDINTLKAILRELVERKEIPAPIHMDRVSLLLSISEELISEMTELAQSTPIISLKEISQSYDTTEESAKIIFEKIAEEGYVNGEFINDDKFVVFNLFANAIISEASVEISKFAEENKLKNEEEEVRILIERMLQSGELNGQFITEDIFICYNNLTDQLIELIQSSAESIDKGDTRRVVFDLGSVVESIVKQSLLIEIQEVDNVDKLPRYHDVIESKELGRILRAAEDQKITLPSVVELKSLNRFWAQKIKHTKPGELPYIPTIEEAREFLFEANRALNRLLSQKLPAKWKKIIAKSLLKE